MRCRACNVALSDEESVRKDEHGYLDLCNHCYYAVDDAEIEPDPDNTLMPLVENYDDEGDLVDAGLTQPTNQSDDSDDSSDYE